MTKSFDVETLKLYLNDYVWSPHWFALAAYCTIKRISFVWIYHFNGTPCGILPKLRDRPFTVKLRRLEEAIRECTCIVAFNGASDSDLFPGHRPFKGSNAMRLRTNLINIKKKSFDIERHAVDYCFREADVSLKSLEIGRGAPKAQRRTLIGRLYHQIPLLGSLKIMESWLLRDGDSPLELASFKLIKEATNFPCMPLSIRYDDFQDHLTETTIVKGTPIRPSKTAGSANWEDDSLDLDEDFENSFERIDKVVDGWIE
ncbi:hypothetical protein MMC12_005421 [Toensbergia leucococca]|nr:hypothetical protein [Toensbergia leucococca]